MLSEDDLRFLAECHAPISALSQAACVAGEEEHPDEIAAVDAVQRIAFSLQPDVTEDFAVSYFYYSDMQARRELLASTIGFCEGYLTLMLEGSAREKAEDEHIHAAQAQGVTSIFAAKRIGGNNVQDVYDYGGLQNSDAPIRMMGILQKIRVQLGIPKTEPMVTADRYDADPKG